MDLKDKNVIVTGGAKGIGRALVDKLTKEDAVVGVLDVDAEGLKSVNEDTQNVWCFQCDVTNYGQIKAVVETFYQQFQKIDVLVNNAGILYSAPLISITGKGIAKHDVGMWDRVISTDLSSVFYMTSNVVEKMISKRTRGVIVNISSVCASGNAGQSAYSAAKAGVNALTVTWAKELSLLGIRVVGIAPGYTDTESTKQAMNVEALKEIVSEVPLRRLGKAEEIAEAVISAIKNDFFNGKVFQVDGGLVI